MESTQGEMLSNDVAIVTGASRGIGATIAIGLAREGVAVVLAARSNEKLGAVAAQITGEGGRALVVPTDLEDDASVAALIPAAVGAFGKLTILVNNAGLGIYGPVEKTPTDDWDRVMRVNARAPFLLCRDAIAPMREAGGGLIFNVSSVVGVKGYVNQAIYGASKHAMMGYSKVLAQEVQEDNIRVHTICPGGVDTDLVAQARPDLDPSILMRPEEVARVVLFLLTFRDGRAVIDDVHMRRAAGTAWF